MAVQEEFKSEVSKALTKLKKRNKPFTTDDIWEIIGGPSKWMVDPRAMGNLLKEADKQNRIYPLAEERRSKRPECHGRPLRVWMPLKKGQSRPEPVPFHQRPKKVASSAKRTPDLNDPKWLWEEYVFQGRSVMALANELQIHSDNIIHALKKNEIEIRRGAEDVLSVPFLCDAFVAHGLNILDISNITGAGPGTVDVLLERYEIPLSAKGAGIKEARRYLSHWRKTYMPKKP